MSCTQKQQLVCFPKVRVYKPWFRHFNDHKDFRNEGTVHLFSLMALFSYANFRSNERVINGDRYMEAPGQWICKLGALPRILRVHSKTQALELMEYFQNHGFLTFEILDEEKEILRFTIADWKEHCTHLQYNYYSYKGSGFFFFPLPVGRLLLKTARKEVGIVFSELDAIMDMWLHTILNDPKVRGSEYMPVVYYSNMRGMPLLSYTYLARRWGWSKSRVGRFMLKAGEYGIISRVSFSSSRGSVISMCRYREFEDRTDEAKADYETDTMRVIRYPDGTIRSIYDRIFTDKFYIHEDVIYQYGAEKSIADKLQTEESKALELVNDYPVKAWYASFEAYCEEHRGYIQDSEGLWGYTYNPNAKWDWWQIGGRFSRNFLVKEDLEDCIISYDRSGGEPDGAPRGYKYVDAARKKDICWDLMKQLTVEEVEKGYQKCVAAFASNDPTGFGPLTKIVEDGIASWGSMIYLKGETLDEFKARKGATDMDQYMISSFAAIDRNGDWLGSGDMGWFGISTNDKEERAWNDELQTLMNEAQDDDFLVVVDCHI